jgi:hypothetical protein
MIYFIQAGDDGPIKIGFSGDPGARQKDLQKAHYEDLRIIGVINGTRELESELHIRFRMFLIRGEWFEPVPEITAFVARNCQSVTKNTVIHLGDGMYQILFYKPVKARAGDVLFFGTHKIKVVIDMETDTILGIEGEKAVLIQFLRDKGVEEKNIQEYIDAMVI